MTASIRKFQQDILDDSNLSHLLNEAYAISIKIKDKKMENWCHLEKISLLKFHMVINFQIIIRLPILYHLY